MMLRERRPTTKKQPKQPGDLQDDVLKIPLTFNRLIGAGGMGEVWEATSDDLPGHSFAIKVIASAYVKNAEAVARFFGEARAASAIDDPNIVTVLGTGRTDDGRPALVMPFINGRSLADLCEERGRLPLDAVAKVLLQVASALRAAHGHQIIHRDIKLHNVMITNRWGREWFVVLVDFGIAKFHDAELGRGIHTNTKQYIGTPGYSAPEQILGKRVDEKADVYSLGVVAYLMLCGRAPYVADNNMQVMKLQLDGAPFEEPKKWRPDIPAVWNDAIVRCLQADPARRPTVSQFAKQIATGIQNGSTLLQFLAPRIAVEARSKATEITLSSDVPTALFQLEAQTRNRQRRFSGVVALLASASLGVVGTAAAFKLWEHRGSASARSDAAAVATTSTNDTGSAASPSGGTAIPSQPVATTPIAPAAREPATARAPAPRSDTGAATSSPAPAASSSPPGDAVAARPRDPPPQVQAADLDASRRVAQRADPVTPARAETTVSNPAQQETAVPPSRVVTAPQPARETQAAAPPAAKPKTTREAEPAVPRAPAEGLLVISVDPFAKVILDGKAVGWTPFRRTIPVGQHNIVLQNEERKITKPFKITVSTDKPAVIEETW